MHQPPPSQPSSADPGAGPGAVRAARPEDAEAIASVQQMAWQAASSPDLAAAGDFGPEQLAAVAAQWRASIETPPTARHRVLVAVEGDPRAGTVVGVAAVAPSTEPDRDPRTASDLLVLSVAPAHGRRGHASRLLAAVADLLTGDAIAAITAWVPDADAPLKHLLLDAGWEPDGARRELESDDARTVVEARWHVGLALQGDGDQEPAQ